VITYSNYLLWYRLHGKDRYMIWITASSDEITDNRPRDRVLIDEAGKCHNFSSPSDAFEFANRSDLKLEDESPILHDLDIVRIWLDYPTANKVNCNAFLAAWNLFTDVSMSINEQDFVINTKSIDRLYDKIFWGCNLLAFTPEGEHFDPIWTAREIRGLKRLIKRGFELFISSLPQH
jgi:hypothetical protein